MCGCCFTALILPIITIIILIWSILEGTLIGIPIILVIILYSLFRLFKR